MLDETLLPAKIEYIEVRDVLGALQVLKDMKTRSLGQVLLFFYSCVVFHRTNTIDDLAARFSTQRPTFDFSMLASLLKGMIGGGVTLKDAAENFIFMFDKARRARAAELARVLPEQAHILTLCNVNGELILVYEELQKMGKQACFFVCETRPYLQGSRQTFWELRLNAIPAKLLCDCQAAELMRAGVVNCVITGADRATVEGDVINKIGTYALARLAKHFNIPYYPLTQYPRQINVDTIAIEERPKKEVFMFLFGNFDAMEAVYPAFDVTRAEYVTKPMELKIGR